MFPIGSGLLYKKHFPKCALYLWQHELKGLKKEHEKRVKIQPSRTILKRKAEILESRVVRTSTEVHLIVVTRPIKRFACSHSRYILLI